MRTPILLSILLAATTGACSQSLTSKMTGTGGAGTGTGDTGGSSPNPGFGGYTGTGGSNVPGICNTLAAEYQSALTAAEGCEVGASGQCQQVVSAALSGCTCSTYVTDSSALASIGNAWQAAGCASGTEPPCAVSCPVALNRTCVSADGGSAGFCSYVPGTGGTSGTGGDGATGGATGAGGSSADGGLGACSTLASEYAAVLIGAKSCTAGAAGQCGKEAPSALSPCSVCMDYVTDDSVLDVIRQKWDAAGCGDVAVACPALSCQLPTSGLCVPGDAGGSFCSTSYQPILPD